MKSNLLSLLALLMSTETMATTLAHQGALKTFATMFQSCEANNVPPMDVAEFNSLEKVVQRTKFRRKYWKRYLKQSRLSEYQKSHPYLTFISENTSSSEQEALGCENVMRKPSVYAYGGTPVMRSGKLALLEDLTYQPTCEGDPGNGARCRDSGRDVKKYNAITGMDCSAFVSSAYAATGLKFKKSQRRSYDRNTTSSIHYIFHNKKVDSCLTSPFLKVDEQLKAGDLINIKANHIVMVDQLGDDPLGINKVSRVEDCGDITVDDFTFSILQSSSTKNMGMNRTMARAYFPSGGNTFRANLEIIAEKLCIAKFRNLPGHQVFNSRNSKFSLLRHVGDERESCRIEPVAMKEEGCVNECF